MPSHTPAAPGLKTLIRAAGFRATAGRLKLLALLHFAGRPLSVHDIQHAWRGTQVDQATLYRSLSSLAAAGIIERADLNTGTAHFEFAPGRPHHHLVCTDCGAVEEIAAASLSTLQNELIRRSKRFSRIRSRALDFFGSCDRCLAKT